MAIQTLFKSQLTDIDSSARDTLGAVRFENNKFYKYMEIKNTTATVAGVAGDPVAFFAATGYSSHRAVIDLSDAGTIPVCCGFLMGSVTGTSGTSYYGWVQLTGPVAVPTAITNGVVGNPVYLTTTDKTLAKSVEADSAAAYKQNVGVELTATAANNVIMADIPF